MKNIIVCVWKTLLTGTLLAGFNLFGQTSPQLVRLQAVGPERRLPDRIFGSNLIPFYERLMEDPAKIALLRTMSVASTRFPGGTDSQFYNPDTGKIEVPSGASLSGYRKFWADIAPRLNALHPRGISSAEYKKFADAIGSEVVMVTNFDTAGFEAEANWFKRMKAEGSLTRFVEMGNETYLGMGQDPEFIKRYPDEAHSEAIAKQCYEAIKPYLLPGTKVAFQASPEGFSVRANGTSAPAQRFRSWNDSLAPKDWFQAVTVHLYAPLTTITGQGSRRAQAMPPVDNLRMFGALMSRFDSGTDHMVQRIASRLPGKEIWVTEWNPRGGDPASISRPEAISSAVQMHVAARTQLALLRHPEVTLSHFFMLNFDNQNNFTVFVKEGGQYRKLPIAESVSWFNNAANGGATYRDYVWGGKIRGGMVIPDETYYPVEAATFVKGKSRTMIIQNATGAPYAIDLTPFGPGTPSNIEMMDPDMAAMGRTPANVKTVSTASSTLSLPPFSLVRIIWDR